LAVYRQVHTTFWQDADMIEYEPEEKYFYLYLMTNPHTTQCGIYEVSKRLMSIELGYPIDTVSILLKKFVDRGKILYSEDTKEIFIINWLKYNSLKSPKVKACVEKELKSVKNKAFIAKFRDLCIQYEYPIDTLSIDYGEEKEEEEEKEKEEEEEILSKQLDDDNNPFKYYQKNIGPMLPDIADLITQYQKGLPDELIVEAFKLAVRNNARSMRYAEKIMLSWLDKGIRTMADYRRHEAEWENKKAASKPGEAEKGLDKRKYSQDEIEAAARYIKKSIDKYNGKDVIGYIHSLGYPEEISESAIALLIERKELVV